MSKNKKVCEVIGEVYFHINNGGITFEVKDEGFGPTIEINATHMGHITNKIKLHTNKHGINMLASLLNEAKMVEYSKEYVESATVRTANN